MKQTSAQKAAAAAANLTADLGIEFSTRTRPTPPAAPPHEPEATQTPKRLVAILRPRLTHLRKRKKRVTGHAARRQHITAPTREKAPVTPPQPNTPVPAAIDTQDAPQPLKTAKKKREGGIEEFVYCKNVETRFALQARIQTLKKRIGLKGHIGQTLLYNMGLDALAELPEDKLIELALRNAQ